MEKEAYIQALLQDIERELANECSPEGLAARHYVSPRQLYRDFSACTGHTVKEYIRKRRISNACEKIKASDLPLDVIAQQSSCGTQQAFHKQFKSTVGLTPLDYRRGDSYFYFYPFTLPEIGIAVKVGAETIPPCSTLRYYDGSLRGIEDKALAALGTPQGRVFGRGGRQIGSRFCYELRSALQDGDSPHSEGHTAVFASCVVPYHEAEINRAWNYLYNSWLSASMFEESGEGYFEEYLLQNGVPQKLKLYLPVTKRRGAAHISIAELPERHFLLAKASGFDAEQRAAEQVTEFLRACHPLLIQNAKRFYVCETGESYCCGIECAADFRLPGSSTLALHSAPAGRYAVLPETCLGDVSIGTAKLDAWLQNNSIAQQDDPVFAVYETKDGKYDNESISMKLYKRLK